MNTTPRHSTAKTRNPKRAVKQRTRLPNSKDLYVQNVPARVLLQAKTRAVAQGKTLRGFVIEALKAYCARATAPPAPTAPAAPTSDSAGAPT